VAAVAPRLFRDGAAEAAGLRRRAVRLRGLHFPAMPSRCRPPTACVIPMGSPAT